MCRKGTAYLVNLKSKKFISLPKDTAEIETRMAEKSQPWDQANRRQKLGLV
jgi:hypothetical protein